MEVGTSDSLNIAYKSSLRKAHAKRDTAVAASSDPLALQPNQEQYHQHINEVVGTELFPPRLGPFDITPKASGSRLDPALWTLSAEGSDDELDMVSNDGISSQIRKVVKVEQVEEEDILVQSISDEEREDQPGFFDGDHFPELDEDEEMRSVGDDSRPHSRLGSLSPLTPLSSNHSSPYSSPQSSRPPSPDESKTLFLRPSDEQEEILDEIHQLYNSVPELLDDYELIDRLGTGTFSSVYKAVDLCYNEWYNQPWLGNHPPESSAHYQSMGPNYKGRGGRATRLKQAMDEDREHSDDHDDYTDEKAYVAVKRIYTTSGPDRIRNELSILEDCRGCRHTSQIITAFRNADQVVIVLPYQRNVDFRVGILNLTKADEPSYLF